MKAIDSGHFLIHAQFDPEQVPHDEYFKDIAVFRKGFSLDLHPNVTFLVGENGSGKSTLLEALAIGMGMNPEGGSRNYNFSYQATHSSMHEHVTLVKGIKRPKDTFFLRAESFYNLASEMDRLALFGSDAMYVRQFGSRSLHEVSHGESFLALMNHRLRARGLYFFDEPEAALSPQGQMSFLVRLHELVQQGAQCVIATHSPIIMAYPKADIYEFTDRIEKVKYESARHVQLTRDFIEHREMMINRLIGDIG